MTFPAGSFGVDGVEFIKSCSIVIFTIYWIWLPIQVQLQYPAIFLLSDFYTELSKKEKNGSINEANSNSLEGSWTQYCNLVTIFYTLKNVYIFDWHAH